MDYLFDSHINLGYSSSSMDNRATGLDSVRFWWEMYPVEGMSLAEVLDIMQLAGPNSFYGGVDPEIAGPKTNGPGTRIRNAGYSYDALKGTSWGAIWANAAVDHGVHR